MRKLFLLGLMAVLLPLATLAQNALTVSVNGGQTFTYNGEVQKPKITVTASTDGYIEPLTENDYTVTYIKDSKEEEPLHAGTYTITVEGKAGTRFGVYTSGTTTFNIATKSIKGRLDVEGSATKTYGAENDLEALKTVIHSAPEGVLEDDFENFLQCLTFIIQDTKTAPKDVRNDAYRVEIVGINQDKDNPVSDYSYPSESENNTVLNLTIEARKLTPVITTSYTYNATDQKNAILADNTVSFTGAVEGEESKIKLELSHGDEIKNAGSYTLKANVKNVDDEEDFAKNYTCADLSLTVEKADLNIIAKEEASLSWGKTYGEADPVITLSNYFDVNWQNQEPSTVKDLLSVERTDGENVGPYVFIVSYNGEVINTGDIIADNYIVHYDQDAQKFTITEKDLTEEDVTISVTDLKYQGKPFDPTDLKVTYNNTEITSYTHEVKKYSDANTVTEGDPINSEDQFKVTVKFNGNYTGSKTSALYTIEQRELIITAKTENNLSKIYGQPDPENLIDSYNFGGDGWATSADGVEENPETIGLTMVRQEGENVGSYYVRLYKDNEQVKSQEYGSKFGNYNVIYEINNDNSLKFNINKRSLYYHIADMTKTYDTTAELPTPTFMAYAASKEDDGLIAEDKIEDIWTTEPTVSVRLAEGETAVNVNDEDNPYIVYVETAGTSKNYDVIYKPLEDGDKYNITPAIATITISNDEIEFGTDLENYVISLNKKAQADNKFAKIDITDNVDRAAIRKMLNLLIDEAIEAQGKSGEYTIAATITANNENDNIVLKNYGYGLVDEKGNPTHFVIKTGVLTIGGIENRITLDALAEVPTEEGQEDNTIAYLIDKYNGAVVKEVAIKNLTNFLGSKASKIEPNWTIKAERWYTLVLPFEVTVRELSEQFGYAIVNIPDEDNNKDGAYFKLTMQTIPANTLMAFKVDQTMEWKDTDTLAVFTNKTIVATDNADVYDFSGHHFIGVYEQTPINDYNDWILWPADGKYYHANAWSEDLIVYPLNGYIHFENNANANIYMEGIDGTITAVNAITGEEVDNSAEGWYSVDGVKLNGKPAQKGIYIHNGKKVVIQ